MPTEIKICGLRDAESLDAALDAGADYVGFVFFEKSPRHVTPQAAKPLMEQARGRARRVALAVDPDAGLLAILADLAPDFIQLHGRETPDDAARIAATTGIPVIKALGVGTAADLAACSAYAAAGKLLLDAKPPRAATRPGGNGTAFDWSILDGFAPGRPWLLSGGLAPDNVAAALRISGAPAVDVSSGVESRPGVKDPALIRAFVAAVRNVDAPRRLAG